MKKDVKKHIQIDFQPNWHTRTTTVDPNVKKKLEKKKPFFGKRSH